eukprot:6214621-Pleurochrysis_carterae.AAC.5
MSLRSLHAGRRHLICAATSGLKPFFWRFHSLYEVSARSASTCLASDPPPSSPDSWPASPHVLRDALSKTPGWDCSKEAHGFPPLALVCILSAAWKVGKVRFETTSAERSRCVSDGSGPERTGIGIVGLYGTGALFTSCSAYIASLVARCDAAMTSDISCRFSMKVDIAMGEGKRSAGAAFTAAQR